MADSIVERIVEDIRNTALHAGLWENLAKERCSGDPELFTCVCERLNRYLTTLDPPEIEPYQIEQQVGEGGLSAIYKATKALPNGDRVFVTLKALKPEHESVRAFARFTRSAQKHISLLRSA